MHNDSDERLNNDATDDIAPEIELSDADILDAMQHISGYLDISTEDFRTIYHLAHRHAVTRLLGNLRAANLMRVGFEPLLGDMSLDQAAKALVTSGYKALPVVDDTGYVIGMLTETDFLRQLKANTLLEVLLSIPADGLQSKHPWHMTLVRAAMTTPAVTVAEDAGFRNVIGAFNKHLGRSLPVVKQNGTLLGLLFRKDFFAQLENIR